MRTGGEHRRMSKRPLSLAFKRLAWSNLAAQFAEQISLAAIPLVAVASLGAGPGETGFLLTAQTLPFLLFALPAGLLADRYSRRKLLVFGEAARAASLACVVLFLQLQVLELTPLALLAFVGACGTVLYSVVAPALVPSLVVPAQLGLANSRLELARTVAFASGPALAGALIGFVEPSLAFWLATLLSLSACALLARLPQAPACERRAASAMASLREGIRFVFRHEMLRPIFVTQLVFNVAFYMIQAVFVPYAVHRLGLAAPQVGLVLACYGVGLVVGAALAPRLADHFAFGSLVVVGPVAGVCGALLLLLTVWQPTGFFAGLAFFLFGAGPILWVISTATLRQTVTPTPLLGRVSAVNTLAYGARPVGATIGGVIGAALGAEVCLAVAVAGFLLQLVVIARSPVVRLTRQPCDQRA